MKYAYWGFGMLLFGIIGLVVIVMFESITLDNDSEYYVLKEAMEAAMLESVDISCFRISKNVDANGCDGKLKMSEQKFVENFTRRFAASISGDVDEYKIEFYDIMELPPKASVSIISTNKSYKFVSDSIDINNTLSGILEVGWGEYRIVHNDTVESSEVDNNYSIPIDNGSGEEYQGTDDTTNHSGDCNPSVDVGCSGGFSGVPDDPNVVVDDNDTDAEYSDEDSIEDEDEN